MTKTITINGDRLLKILVISGVAFMGIVNTFIFTSNLSEWQEWEKLNPDYLDNKPNGFTCVNDKNCKNRVSYSIGNSISIIIYILSALILFVSWLRFQTVVRFEIK